MGGEAERSRRVWRPQGSAMMEATSCFALATAVVAEAVRVSEVRVVVVSAVWEWWGWGGEEGGWVVVVGAGVVVVVVTNEEVRERRGEAR